MINNIVYFLLNNFIKKIWQTIVLPALKTTGHFDIIGMKIKPNKSDLTIRKNKI